jgi:hypothetical protein
MLVRCAQHAATCQARVLNKGSNQKPRETFGGIPATG